MRDMRGGGPSAPAGNRYMVREKLMSIGDDSWIEDAQGRRAYKIDGKALRVRSTFVLEDADGNEVATIQERMLRVRDQMEIERGGRAVARIRKALVSPLRDRFDVELADGSHWRIQGNVLAHEYEIEGDGGRVAQISKQWFRVRDFYGVEVVPRQDDGLVLALTAAVDEMRRE
jgi:uncharacterized protein YxjI